MSSVTNNQDIAASVLAKINTRADAKEASASGDMNSRFLTPIEDWDI